MNEATSASPNKIQRSYFFSAIGIAIMLLFPLLPAPEPITPAGMTVIGLFIGLVFLWSLVDLLWPTFIAIVLFGTVAQDVFPDSFQNRGIYEAGMQSFGNWIVLFVLGCLILTVALHKVGTIRRIAFWFMTREFAKRGLWAFTFMFLLATLVVGCFVDVTPVQIFMLGIAYEIFDDLGYDKSDHWPRIVVVGVTFSAIISFVMTPISHPLPILFLGIMQDISGVPVNLLLYMLVGVPVGLVIFLLMFAWFRYFVKLDPQQFEKFDLAAIEAKRPGPMDSRERATNIICLIVLAAWIVPGFTLLVAPDSGINALMQQIGITAPLFVAISALALLYVDERPLLNLKEAFADLEWTPVVFLASVIMVAGCMGERTTGIPGFMETNFIPLLEGLSPFAVVAGIAVLCCLITNIANNVAVGIIFIVAGTPLALSMGMNPILIGMAVCIGANLAYTIPPSFVPVGIAYASPWGGGGVTFRNGLAMTVISCVVMAVLLYPLSLLVFGR